MASGDNPILYRNTFCIMCMISRTAKAVFKSSARGHRGEGAPNTTTAPDSSTGRTDSSKKQNKNPHQGQQHNILKEAKPSPTDFASS